ncbi:MAG: RNA-binding S4 domain-containing protein [Betaproteobacteria bacterium]
MKRVVIHTPHIELDQFLKWAGMTGTGGGAKELVAAGKVRVNGELETRRGRKLYPGDVVEAGGEQFRVASGEE